MPGFIDTHTHGGAGYDYSQSDPDGIIRAVNAHFACGTTTLLPTILTQSYEGLRRALGNIRAAKESGKAKADIAGVHIEGPYLSAKQAGAQNPTFITAPIREDYTRLVEEFGGLIKKWTYAPERDTDGAFCRYLAAHGILPSAGHTDATGDDFARAYKEGCRSITHLYSCTSSITREGGFRRLGVTECAYAYDDVFAELIADGKHIPSELLRLVFKLKPAEKIVLVSDSLLVAQSDIKEGVLGGIPFIVEDGVAKLRDKTAFAGSVATMDRLVGQCVQAGIATEKAVCAETKAPAQSLSMRKGSLQTGYVADILVASPSVNGITVKRVIARGKDSVQ